MASTNQSPFYQKAESKFLTAENDDDRLTYLEEMIRECPKHKSAEKMLAKLKTRYKKLKEKIEKTKSIKKSSSKKGIKKEEMQAAIIGFTNSGKSTLISILTNARPNISWNDQTKFTTKKPEIGMMEYPKNVLIQIVEIPSIESPYYEKSLANTADIILTVVTKIKDIEKVKEMIKNSRGKQIIVFNKIDNLTENEKRKIQETLRSKKHDFVLTSSKTNEGIADLKEKIFRSFDKMRIYTKHPGKGKAEKPIVLNKGSIVKDVAEKIFHGFSNQVKEVKITGPSSKFSNQKVSLNHELKDLDIVEFRLR
tara:strand:- start:654 stop:1580 length:927 start_codon:yes stop_codon:yes gene_type:complete